jgi:prefoldin subunit 5
MIDIYEAIKQRENQLTILQTQISTLQEEIKALRVAARILEGGNASSAGEVTASASSSGAEKTRVWP